MREYRVRDWGGKETTVYARNWAGAIEAGTKALGSNPSMILHIRAPKSRKVFRKAKNGNVY